MLSKNLLKIVLFAKVLLDNFHFNLCFGDMQIRCPLIEIEFIRNVYKFAHRIRNLQFNYDFSRLGY